MLLEIVSVDEGRPGVGAGAVRCGDSVVVLVMSVRLGRSPGSDGLGGSCCNPLRRCNSRAVNERAGGATEAIFEEGRELGSSIMGRWSGLRSRAKCGIPIPRLDNTPFRAPISPFSVAIFCNFLY